MNAFDRAEHAGDSAIEALKRRLAALPVAEVRRIARLGRLHARLTKQNRKAHGLTATQAKVLARLSSTRLGI